MKRLFITGMSGTGKSAAIEALRARGFTAIDTDYEGWCELSSTEGAAEWIWHEERMKKLLAAPLAAPLFVAGCVSNQRKFYEYFAYRILLSAPLDVMLSRVRHRPSNPYGQSEADSAEICRNYEQFQPLLKKSADFEMDSSVLSVPEIADFLTKLAFD